MSIKHTLILKGGNEMQMFSKKEVTTSFDLIIGPNSTVKGNLESEASIRIDGIVSGNITSKGNVILSEYGKIEGDIICENLELNGQCIGNVKAKGKVELSKSSRLTGDIICMTLNTEQGARFEGNCKVLPEYDLVIETQKGFEKSQYPTYEPQIITGDDYEEAV